MMTGGLKLTYTTMLLYPENLSTEKKKICYNFCMSNEILSITEYVSSELYPWQQDCLEVWFAQNCRGVVNAVTGSGKTKLAVHAAKLLKEKLADNGDRLRIRVVVPKTFLAAYWRNAFLREGVAARSDTGVYCGAHKDDPSRMVMIYLLNSARYTLARRILEDIRSGWHVLLIADECHHLAGEKNLKILDFIPRLGLEAERFHALALSATVGGLADDSRFRGAFGGVVYSYGLSRALRDGIISDFMLLPVGVRFLPREQAEYQELSLRLSKAALEVKKLYPILRNLNGSPFFAMLEALSSEAGRAGDAARRTLGLAHIRREKVHAAENRIFCACELVFRMPSDSKIILFGERIACAKRIFTVLNERLPGQTALYHSGMGQEAMRASLARYQAGEARILITCRALDEGLDIPETDVGIIVASTRTERQRVQRLGRLLRKGGSPLPAKLYYLYIEDGGGEAIYLERDFPFPLIPLSFERGDEASFHSPVYDALAAAAAARFDSRALTKPIRMELQKHTKGDGVRRYKKLAARPSAVGAGG